MDWGLLIGILSGVVGIVGIGALFSPGLATFIGSVFSTFTRVLFTVYHGLPKPIKLLFFLLLFFSVGVLMFNFTVGATHMCYEDKLGDQSDVVYKIGFFEGLSLNFWQVITGDYLSVELEFHEANVVTPGVTVDLNGNPINASINSTHASIRIVDDELSGYSYTVLFGLAPTTAIRTSFWQRSIGLYDYDELQSVPEEAQWDLLPGTGEDGQVKTYLICLDDGVFHEATETCVLKDASKYEACDTIFSGSGTLDPWSQSVGVIQYEYHESVDVEKGITRDVVSTVISPTYDPSLVASRGFWANTWAYIRSFVPTPGGRLFLSKSVDDCHNLLPELDADGVPGAYDAVADLGYTRIEFNYDDVTHWAYIYNAQYFPMKVARDACEDLGGDLDCSLIQGSPGRLFFDTYHEAIKAIRKSVTKNAADDAKLVYNRKSIINYACNEDTSDQPFDSKLLVMGIDILNPKYMVFFVLFGVILGFFGYLAKFR